MRFGALGPFEVVDDSGADITPGAAKQRALLAVLLCHRNTPVSVDRLIDTFWPDVGAPARRGLQIHVHRLRKGLGRERIEHGPAGYLLRVDAATDVVEDEVFEHQVSLGLERLENGDPEAARARLGAALELWRGPAYAGVDDVDPVRAEAARLDEFRLTTLENRIRADLDMGRHAEVVAELSGLAAEHPLRERLRGLLMLALHRSGRSADALEAYRDARQSLVDELGMEPGNQLREIERAILTDDPQIAAPRPGAAVPTPAPSAVLTPFEVPAADAYFTGRETDVTKTVAVLRGVRPNVPVVVAISGPAGAGKSALARQAAHAVVDDFPDGQVYVDLQGATPGATAMTPRDALGRMLRSLGLGDDTIPEGADEAAATFRSITAERRVLIVLDNAHDSSQVRPLLPGRGGGSAVVITSRAVLAALDVAQHVQLSSLSDHEAVGLLERLAGADRVVAEPDAASEVVAMCDRLPLAVRIAGARLTARPDWSLTVMCERLRDHGARLDELVHGDLAVRSSCAVSIEALAADTATVFAALGLVDLPDVTAAGVAALVERPVGHVRADLDRLVEAQLLRAVPRGRFVMHDLIRLYARELSAEVFTAGERHDAVVRLAHHHLATARVAFGMVAPGRPERCLVGVADEDLTGSPAPVVDGDSAAVWIRDEAPALGAVVAAVANEADEGPALVAGLGAVLGHLLHSQGLWSEQLVISRMVLDSAQRSGRQEWMALAENDMGMIMSILRRFDEAKAHLNRFLTIATALDDESGIALALDSLGNCATQSGHPADAIPHFRRAIELLRRMGKTERRGRSLNNLAWALQACGEFEASLRTYEEALALSDPEGHGTAIRLLNVGQLHLARDDHDTAEEVFQHATAIFERAGDSRRRAITTWHIGTVRDAQGEHGAARELWRNALEIIRAVGVIDAADVEAIMVAEVPERPAALRDT